MEDNTQSQTQPQAKQLLDDIFGDSDDEKNVTVASKPAPTAKSSAPAVDSDDDIFAGSDKDEDNKVSDNKMAQKMPSLADDNLLDSDDDDVVQPKKGFTRKKRPKGPVTKIGKLKKRKTSVDIERSRGGNSGDEYDSGEDLGATKEDMNFLAEDDDFADIVKEYDEDNTDFNDDRPDDYDGPLKKKKKSSSSVDMPHHSSGINLKDQDPLSQTLAAMKNPKAKALSDQEKDILVEKLQLRMAKAVKMDNELYAQQQPATHKMALLEAVQTTLMMKPLHQTLLDKDILSSIRDWIEPRDANTLPALSVRATMYELLMQLPCLPDHLKRSNNEKPPIGVTIVALRKHKMETTANKRTLKELMDKWSRPIFSKSADVRLGGSGGGVASMPTEHPEMQEAILQRYASQLAQSDKTAREAAERAQSADGNTSSSSSTRDNARARNVGFDSLMSGQQSDSALGDGEGAANTKKKAADNHSRARTPYNTGFLFTVQPELKNIDKRNVMERSLGEGRMKLFKKMSEGGGGGGKGLGKKSNPRYSTLLMLLYLILSYLATTTTPTITATHRAMDMSVSVGPKH